MHCTFAAQKNKYLKPDNMKRLKMNLLFKIAFAGIALIAITTGLQSCSKKSKSSKSATTAAAEIKEPANTPAPPAEEKDGMQIKRDAAGNYVIQLVIRNMDAVKLMKPVKEGYIVWMTNESNVTTSIGTVEGANTWTDKKDKVRFEATSAVKPIKVFITAETNLVVDKPGTQVVWSTGNF